MNRLFAALAVCIAAAAAVRGHAVYLVPDAADAGKITVVFSDDLNPDAKVREATWKKLDGFKLTARTASGTATVAPCEKGEHCLKALVPADARLVFGQVDYGVSTRHVEKPTFVKFYPKAILGPIPADGGKIGEACELEVVPSVEGSKVRFQVLAAGKPVAGAAVSVMIPAKNGEKADATTDDRGFIPAFVGTGRYAATVRRAEEKAGEADGQKFAAINRVATLVVDVK